MTPLALDMSTVSCGWCCNGSANLFDPRPRGWRQMHPDDALGRSLLSIQRFLTALIDEYQPDCIVYETPFMSPRTMSAFHPLAKVEGVCHAVAAAHELLWVPVAPTVWQSWCRSINFDWTKADGRDDLDARAIAAWACANVKVEEI